MALRQVRAVVSTICHEIANDEQNITLVMLFVKLISFVIFNSFVFVVNGANILALFPLQFKSHYIIFDPVLSELARRGHNVTVVNAFPKSPPLSNFIDIDVSECNQLPADFFTIEGAYRSHDAFVQVLRLMEVADQDELFMKCPPFQRLLRGHDSYDLVISELFASDLMLAFGHKFKAPFISFSAASLYPWGAHRTGNPDNPSYITYNHSPMPLDRRGSTFYQRLFNVLLYAYSQIWYYWTDRRSEALKIRYFGFEKPTLQQISENTSLVLIFTHISINTVTPLVPNVIPVAGLQIQQAKKLPKDIQKFIDESEHGVIYFSMGSILQPETMPEEKREAFLNVFSKFPQRILWKYGNDTLPGKSDRIFIAKWMPQRDIMAHPNVKLFIGHGGALGVNEAVYESIPILGIPIYADQTVNLKILQSHGAAEILEYEDINYETVLNKLQLMLDNEEYSKNMKRISAIFRDRPLSAMDTAIYWIEYVIRYKGAPHLRSAAVGMPLYQYLLLDIIIFVIVVSSFTSFIIYNCLKFSCKLIFKAKTNKSVKKLKLK